MKTSIDLVDSSDGLEILVFISCPKFLKGIITMRLF